MIYGGGSVSLGKPCMLERSDCLPTLIYILIPMLYDPNVAMDCTIQIGPRPRGPMALACKL
jgi:hypothetical protein